MTTAYWCRTCDGGHNFGDQLTPIILNHYGIPHTWAPPSDAHLFAVGSIATKIPTNSTATIVGTGLIRDVAHPLPNAHILALRGPLTAQLVGREGPRSVPFGDPGVLVPMLFPARDDGRYLTVVVPHIVDRDLPKRFIGTRSATIVPVTTSPRVLTAAIAGASHVITSSLHALIAADAYGIPHTWIPHADVIGGGFKFRDYITGLGLPAGHLTRPERLTPRDLIGAQAATLDRIFTTLATEQTT